MNYGDLQTACQRRIGDTTADMLTKIKEWLNQAQDSIFSEVDGDYKLKEDSISTVSGTWEYSLPTDLQKIYDVRLMGVTNWKLAPVSARDFDRYKTDIDQYAAGKPIRYFIFGGKIYLYPKPDAVYTLKVRYYRLPTALSADTDASIIPARWHWLLVEFVVATALEELEDLTGAGMIWQKYFRGLERLRADLVHPDEDFYMRDIRVVSSRYKSPWGG